MLVVELTEKKLQEHLIHGDTNIYLIHNKNLKKEEMFFTMPW